MLTVLVDPPLVSCTPSINLGRCPWVYRRPSPVVLERIVKHELKFRNSSSHQNLKH